MKSYQLLGLAALSMTVPAPAALVNYVITGYASGSAPIVSIRSGSTTDVSGANASGGPTNSILKPAGVSVDFTMGDANQIVGDKFAAASINALPTVATLRVTLDAVSAGGTEVMIARTLNSQGLEDIGTLSLLLTGLNGANLNTQTNSATFRFDWRNAANTGSLGGSDQMVFTSYDLDFTQRNKISESDWSTISRATPTVLNLTSSAGMTTIVDPGPGTSSTTTNAANAYAFVTEMGDFSQTISVDKVGGGVVASGYGTQGNQLYMFSFRSPSPLNIVVPEPSSAVIAGLGVLALLRRRRA